MILYFSGTDNSRHVAKSMQDPRTVDIKKALQQKRCGFTLKENESVGIVCPVYYSGIPKTVLEFISHMKLKGEISYVYAILTHGGGPGASGNMLRKALKKKGYPLHACFDVKMPSNYIMFGPLGDEEEEKQRIIDAEPVIASIRESVQARKHELPDWSRMERFLSDAMYPLCNRYMSTKKFYADDRCVGCGVCASRCPSKCIEMIDGKPVWTRNACVRCMACLRCNAVQYGKKTQTYRRYAYKPIPTE